MIAMIIFAALGLVGIILAIATKAGGWLWLGIPCVILALIMLFMWNKDKKANKAARDAFAKYYDAAKLKACKIVADVLAARAKANALVAEFESNADCLKLFVDKKKEEAVAADVSVDDLGLDDLGLEETAPAEEVNE